MGLVTGVTYPNEGDRIKAANYNSIIQKIIAEMNGNLNDSNISGMSGSKLGAGTVTQDKLASDNFTGWKSQSITISSVTHNGDNSYDIATSTDTTSILSPGTRMRFARATAANTYMGGLFNGSSQYFIKTSPTGSLSTVTNNFTIMAYIRPTSYTQFTISGRSDATPANNIVVQMNSNGQIQVSIRNGGSGNTRLVATYRSVPLNKTTHIAVTWSSGTVVIYFNGASVPVQAATTAGTAPTTAGTGGDFAIGRHGAYAGEYANGYISNVAWFDAVLSAANIRQYMTYKLTGSETNCIGAWSLDNTAVNQQAPGTNDLTATGSVGYNNSAPFMTNGFDVTDGTNKYDFGIVQKVTAGTITVQMASDCTLPGTGSISTVYYSQNGSPYGFPDKGRFNIISIWRQGSLGVTTPSSGTWQPANAVQVSEPTGKWRRSYNVSAYGARGSAGTVSLMTTLSETSGAETDNTMNGQFYINAVVEASITVSKESKYLNPNTGSARTLYFNIKPTAGSMTAASVLTTPGTFADSTITLENAYAS